MSELESSEREGRGVTKWRCEGRVVRGQRLAGRLSDWLGEGGRQECVGCLMVVLGATIGL